LPMLTYRTIIVTLILGLFLFTWAHAEVQWVSLGADDPEEVRLSVLEAEPGRTVVELRLEGYWQDQVDIQGTAHMVFALPSRTNLMEKGLPDLPKVRERLIVPDDARMAVRVLEADQAEVETSPIAPSKGHLPRTIDPATVPYEFDQIYQSDAWYPASPVELGDPFILRDFRGVSVQINPLQYNPAKGRLRVCRRMVVEVYSDGPGRVNLKRRTKSLSRMDADFKSLYQRLFLNYSAAKYTALVEQGRMLIVCYNGFASDILPLYQWKLQKGIPTKLALYPDSTGSGNTALKGYIQNEYDSPEGLTYIMLVGDEGQIPTNSGTAEGAPSDPCYVKLEGGDHYPDAFISRLSATTSAQVDNQVEKFIDYEMSPDTGAPAAWYHQACGIASSETGGTGIPDYDRMELLRTDLLGYTYTHVDQIYDPGATAAQVTTAVNDGRSLINYIGHGSGTSWGTTGFSNSHVNALSNGHMLPYICDVACLNGDFTMGGDCFAEAWLKAGSAGSPKGGITHYASSTLADWVPPCVMQAEVVDLLVAEQKSTFGGLSFNGVMKAMDENPGYAGTKLMEQYNLFGDCSLVMRTDVPTAMTVTHDPVVFVDASSYDLQVAGLEGALASLYHDGIFYGSAYTNAAGNATIDLIQPFPGPGQVTLTVTAYNKIPYITALDVVTPSGPYMVYQSHVVGDVVGGNGDGVVNPGETIVMPVTLRNAGSDPATAVSAALRIDDVYAVISDSLESYGDIPAGSTATSLDSYDFQVLGDCPDGHLLDFTLEISSAETIWVNHGLNIIVAAPSLAYEDHSIDDSGGGDGDGQPDPGETFDMIISLKNWGSGTATGVSAQLSSPSPHVTVPVDSSSYGDILSDQTVSSQTAYTLSIDAGCPDGHVADLIVGIAAGSYATADTFQISIGQLPILLVDDDDGQAYQSYWVDALNANGYSYDVWEITAKGSPPLDSLNLYRIILWTTADDYGSAGSPTTLTATDQANLQAYLDAGGNLFLSSQDLLYDNSPVTSFISDYLHVADHTDDTHPTEMNGFAGDPISDGMGLLLSFPFSNWADDIVVGAGATCVFEIGGYSREVFSRDGSPAQENPVKSDGGKQGACGGLRYPDVGSDTYKVVFFAFPFEAISTSDPDPNNQNTVLANIVDWFLGDFIPPSQVTNLRSVLSEDQLILEWSPSTDDKGVDYYVIYREKVPDYVPSATESIATTVDSFFVDASSAVGDTVRNYFYCVKAVDGAGNKSIASQHVGEFDVHLITLPGSRASGAEPTEDMEAEGH
jgi:hypothetical protein